MDAIAQPVLQCDEAPNLQLELDRGAHTYLLSSGLPAARMLGPPPALRLFFGTGPRPRNSAHPVQLGLSPEMLGLTSLVKVLTPQTAGIETPHLPPHLPCEGAPSLMRTYDVYSALVVMQCVILRVSPALGGPKLCAPYSGCDGEGLRSFPKALLCVWSSTLIGD